MKDERFAQFVNDMKAAGYGDALRAEYHGRYFYVGPAVDVEREELQAVIRATAVPLQWDQMGESGLVIYPVA